MWIMVLILAGLIGLAFGVDYMLSGTGYGKSKKKTDIETHKPERDQFFRNTSGRN